MLVCCFFFFKQKTAYEMRISDWSSDVCSSDLLAGYLAWFSVKMVWVSHMLGDVSESADATPLWIPQTAMAVGAVLLAVALADRLISVAIGRASCRERVCQYV